MDLHLLHGRASCEGQPYQHCGHHANDAPAEQAIEIKDVAIVEMDFEFRRQNPVTFLVTES
jgi:hypothetical protein